MKLVYYLRIRFGAAALVTLPSPSFLPPCSPLPLLEHDALQCSIPRDRVLSRIAPPPSQYFPLPLPRPPPQHTDIATRTAGPPCSASLLFHEGG